MRWISDMLNSVYSSTSSVNSSLGSRKINWRENHIELVEVGVINTLDIF